MNTARPTGLRLLMCSAALVLGTAGAQSFEHPEQVQAPAHAPAPPVHTPSPPARTPSPPPPAHLQGPPPPTHPPVKPAPARPPGQAYPPGATPSTPSPLSVQPRTSHHYPPHGTSVSAPPPAPVIINRPSGRYYYSGGVWYVPRGPSYVVVGAPVGVFVPVLPPYYSIVWVAGVPYYFANQTYYSWSPQQNSYQVVEPPQADGIPGPEDADAEQNQDPDATPPPGVPAPSNDGLYVYPQNGQSEQQQATDRYECHQWANLQTGFDPTQTNGGDGGNPDDYQRAMKACLEGRGYSVR